MIWPLKLVYYFLYGLVRFGLWLYYREIRVEGWPDKEPRGPLLVLSNHPNALMDPFLVVSRLTRPVFFLANAGLFRHPFANWFLNTFYCIPVERPKDVNRPIDNTESFRRSREHLEGDGALYIAPEGTCFREFRLRPLKTGAARIALDLLRAGNRNEVKILAAGVTYASPPDYQSRMRLRFAPLMTIRRGDLTGDITDWDHVEALTLQIRRAMEASIPHTDGERDQQLGEATALLAPAFRKPDWDSRLEALRHHLASLPEGDDWWPSIRSGLEEKGLTRLDPGWWQRSFPYRHLRAILPAVLVLVPLQLVAWGLPEGLRLALKADPVYDATIRFLGGMISLPLQVFLFFLAGQALGATWIFSLIAGIGLTIAGPWAFRQWTLYQDVRAWNDFQRVASADPEWSERMSILFAPLRDTHQGQSR